MLITFGHWKTETKYILNRKIQPLQVAKVKRINTNFTEPVNLKSCKIIFGDALYSVMVI